MINKDKFINCKRKLNIMKDKKIIYYFENIVKKVKRVLETDVNIYIANHQELKGHENAAGCAHSRSGKAKDVYMITIDCDCLEFWYEWKNEFGTVELVKYLCHEIAHTKHFRHTKHHEELTRKYEIKALRECINN